MRTSSNLSQFFAKEGFTFAPCDQGFEMPVQSTNFPQEIAALRHGVALTDLSHVLVVRIGGSSALDLLDYVVAGDVCRLREEHILHTVCLSEGGEILTDVYIANCEDEFLLLADGGNTDAILNLLAEYNVRFNAQVHEYGDDYTVFAVDGPYAWGPVKKVFGPEILGLQYMGFLTVTCGEKKAYVLRSGKTGEYGYWIVAPADDAKTYFDEIAKQAQTMEGTPVSLYGARLSGLARLENHFLNLNAEGRFTRDPFELGLFWQVQLEKETVASAALEKLLERGVHRSVVGFQASTCAATKIADVCYLDNRQIGTVVAVENSPEMGADIGLLLVDKDTAYSGLTLEAGEARVPIKTTGTPFLSNKSLRVRPE